MHDTCQSPTITQQNEVDVARIQEVTKLRESTKSSLELLRQWQSKVDFNKTRSSSTRAVVEQARDYVRGINHSIQAAQNGYTFAEEGISLTNAHRDQEGDPKLPDDVNGYVEGMLAVAAKAKRNASDALERFRCVRRALVVLVENAGKTGNFTGKESKSKSESDPTAFRDALPVLEQFEGCLDSYVKWWSKITMDEISQEKNVEALEKYPAELREKLAITNWNSLKNEYLVYKTEIEKLEDEYKSIFDLARGNQKSKATGVLSWIRIIFRIGR